MGKTSLANTFAEFLKSPTAESTKPVLTKGTPLRYTKVMELYDGLSIGMRKNVSVEVTDHAPNVILVKLKLAGASSSEDTDSEDDFEGGPSRESSNEDNKTHVKLIDLGGHSATMLVLAN